eukprot:gene15941-21631_t
MPVLLWPRQEVLQLVVPQLGQIGRPLTHTTAKNLIKRLGKFQTTEGKISYDKWLIVAKENLKWNDSCIHLFWEMLSLATFYLNRDSFSAKNREDQTIDLEFIAIFLIMHIVETQNKQTSSSVGYDTIWPQENGDVLSPVSPLGPLSPPKDGGRSARKSFSLGSPSSPRSPKSSPISPKRSQINNSRQPRSTAQYLHSVRQKIPFILKALVNDDVSTDYNAMESTLQTISRSESFDKESNNLVEFSVSKRIVDSLGLIICGGYSRDQHISSISTLYPGWNADFDSGSKHSVDFMEGYNTVSFTELSSWIDLHLCTNDLLYPVQTTSSYGNQSINSPSARDNINHSNSFDGNEKFDPSNSNNNFNFDSKQMQVPIRILNTVSSLSRFTPTVINSCNTTMLQVITTAPLKQTLSNKKSKSQDSAYSNSSDQMEIAPHTKENPAQSLSDQFDHEVESLLTSVQSTTLSAVGTSGTNTANTNTGSQDITGTSTKQQQLIQNQMQPIKTMTNQNDLLEDFFNEGLKTTTEDFIEMSKYDLSSDSKFRETFLINPGYYTPNISIKPESILPQLFLNFCVKALLYLISPYYSVSINGCSDSEVIIGPVYGALIVNGCERMKITCACRKLIIVNCLDCEFNIATLSTTIISGDSRSLVFGPYNTSYRNLNYHLKLADLEGIMREPVGENSKDPLSPTSAKINTSYNNDVNCWSTLCDVNSCFEAVPTTSSPSGYAIDAMLGSFPVPPSSVATLLPTDKFSPLSIPFKQENLSFEHCVIPVPSDYLEGFQTQKENVLKIKNQISYLMSSENLSRSNSSDKDSTSKVVASTIVAKKFMEWLLAKEHAQSVLDLI